VRAGDTTCVEIEELHVDSKLGLMVTRPGVTGFDITDEPELRIGSCDDSYADVGAFRVPVRPMIGLLGVAPAGEPVSTFCGAEHGGNMDVLLIGREPVSSCPPSQMAAWSTLATSTRPWATVKSS